MTDIVKPPRISVDGEMFGGIVSHFSMVELGACVVENSGEGMRQYGSLIRPSIGHNEPYEHGARKVLRRSYEEFFEKGKDPRQVAYEFVDFCDGIRGEEKSVKLTGVNISFDFPFIREFLYRFCPDRYEVIGYKGYEITSFADAVFDLPLGTLSAKRAWERIKAYPKIYERYYPGALTHGAIQDSIDQAKLLLALEEVQLYRRP